MWQLALIHTVKQRQSRMYWSASTWMHWYLFSEHPEEAVTLRNIIVTGTLPDKVKWPQQAGNEAGKPHKCVSMLLSNDVLSPAQSAGNQRPWRAAVCCGSTTDTGCKHPLTSTHTHLSSFSHMQTHRHGSTNSPAVSSSFIFHCGVPAFTWAAISAFRQRGAEPSRPPLLNTKHQTDWCSTQQTASWLGFISSWVCWERALSASTGVHMGSQHGVQQKTRTSLNPAVWEDEWSDQRQWRTPETMSNWWSPLCESRAS